MSAEGLVSIPSSFDPKETMDRLEAALRASGVTIFARIDHAAGAAEVGETLRPTELLIFGNPKAGTPVMVAAPSIALDLPLKILVWEDAEGKVWCSYNEPEYLQARHHVPQDLVANISVAELLATKAGE